MVRLAQRRASGDTDPPAASPDRDVLYIESLERAAAMLKPLRVELLRAMGSDTTCTELADAFGLTPQKIHYHVKALESAGLVDRVAERRVRGTVEGIYRARARSYWLSPGLVRRLGGAGSAKDQMSLGVLARHAESMLDDVGRLSNVAAEGRHVASLSLAAEISLPDRDQREAFLEEIERTFVRLARKYGGVSADEDSTSPSPFRLTLACYPEPSAEKV